MERGTIKSSKFPCTFTCNLPKSAHKYAPDACGPIRERETDEGRKPKLARQATLAKCRRVDKKKNDACVTDEMLQGVKGSIQGCKEEAAISSGKVVEENHKEPNRRFAGT